ncbi:MAG: XRE family transcriptional regulator [Desulforudis sp.]|jgi:transcriptional regulator with XRE-family HTH domain|nr:MAG: XRE family transcriptional regulator [Desulforudis sp.]
MNRLRELRKRSPFSAAEVAEKLDISVQHLYDLEKGERRLNEDQLRLFADIYLVSTDYVLGLTDDPHPKPGAPVPQKTTKLIDSIMRAKDLPEENAEQIAEALDALIEYHERKLKRRNKLPG